MNPEERRFLRDFLALAAEPTATADELSPDDRAFLTRFLALASDTPTAAGLTARERAFVDQFCALAATSNPEADAVAAFERVIIERWDSMVWRVEGKLARAFTALDVGALAQLRVLEETPSLLAPLRRTRDERSHSEILAWALGLETPLGYELRRAFLDLLRRGEKGPSHLGDVALEGWIVKPERVLGPKCRVDVDVWAPGAWRCLIEMKVDAPERKGQLDDYADHLGPKGVLVFLTPDGRKGQCEAEHQRLSFRQLVGAWLPAATRPERDARYLAMWLVTIAQEICAASQPGSVFRWDLMRRVAILDLLKGPGEADA